MADHLSLLQLELRLHEDSARLLLLQDNAAIEQERIVHIGVLIEEGLASFVVSRRFVHLQAVQELADRSSTLRHDFRAVDRQCEVDHFLPITLRKGRNSRLVVGRSDMNKVVRVSQKHLQIHVPSAAVRLRPCAMLRVIRLQRHERHVELMQPVQVHHFVAGLAIVAEDVQDLGEGS